MLPRLKQSRAALTYPFVGVCDCFLRSLKRVTRQHRSSDSQVAVLNHLIESASSVEEVLKNSAAQNFGSLRTGERAKSHLQISKQTMAFSTIISGITEARMALTAWSMEAAETRCGLLDMRSAAEFSLLHVRGSTNIPAEQVQERSFELPPRGSTLAILADDLAALKETVTYLQGNGYTLALAIGLPQPSSQALEQVLEDPELRERGAVCPPVYLWKPSPCFAEAMSHIEKLLLSEKLETFSDLDSPDSEAGRARDVPARLAVDVGCGAGRDCVWLASRQAVVWDVVGIDNDERLLERYKATSFSQSHRFEAFGVLYDTNLASNLHVKRFPIVEGYSPQVRPFIGVKAF